MIKIKDIYYGVWSDLILGLQKKPKAWKYNKWYALFIMSFCFGFNYVPILFLLPKDLDPLVWFREFHFLSSDFLDTLLHGLILFLLPGHILHYFLVFYKKKYERFTKEYPFRKGKLFINYMSLSLIIPLSILVIAFILNRLM